MAEVMRILFLAETRRKAQTLLRQMVEENLEEFKEYENFYNHLCMDATMKDGTVIEATSAQYVDVEYLGKRYDQIIIAGESQWRKETQFMDAVNRFYRLINHDKFDKGFFIQEYECEVST